MVTPGFRRPITRMKCDPSGVHARELDEDRPDAAPALSICSLLRHDAEHGERSPSIRTVRPISVGSPPNRVRQIPLAQHDDVWWQCLVSRQKRPPGDRLDAEHVEELAW